MNQLKIAIIDIIGIPYDGTTVFKQGLGGSESAVTLVSKELAQLGFNVTVFNNCNIDHASPGVYDNVTYRPLGDLAQDHYFDIIISSRTVIPFVHPDNYDRLNDRRAWPFHGMNLYDRILSKAKMRILWMHDTFCLGDILIEELALANRITNIFALSDWHLTYVANCDHGGRRNFEVLKRKFFITRNGANNYIPEVDIRAKDRNLFVYNASVTKGMVPLVEHVWPRVKQAIPQAQLKIIGGYYRFSSGDQPDEQEKKWRQMADDPANPAKGIEFTGIIPQKDIAQVLAKANFMIYPAAFPETFGISTLESLLYNTPSITCRFGALEEIALEEACYLIDYAIEPNGLFPNISVPAQVDKFVDTVIQAYHNTYLHQQKQYYCNIVKDIAGWDSVAKQWRQFFYKNTGNYLSADDYREVSKINHKVHKIWKRRYHNVLELESYKSGTEQEIVVISPFYNCREFVGRCIESVASQDYTNYRHILIDDCSTDDSFMTAIRAIAQLPDHLKSRFTVIKNDENKGAVRNQIETIRSLNNDAIVMLLDGDDSIVNDNTIFSYYNTIYDGSTEFTYGSCWSMVDNIPLVSQPYPEDVKQRRDYRNHHFNWILPYTHFRTFKKYLLNGVHDSMFQDSHGKWYKAGGDGSVFYSLIEQAEPSKVKCLQEVVYNYNDAHGLNDYKVNGDEQNRNAREIISKVRLPKYSVIVPTMWRVAEQFLGFLKTLCDHPSVDEVIIIDNDPTKTPATGLDHPKVKMFNFGKNIFVNPAWNLGVKTARNERICIVNDDVMFDTALFGRLQDMLTPQNGLFGLCPGEPDFQQPPVTDKSIDIIPWTGQHTYGYGCLMFLHKAIWEEIPSGLEIYFGDNFIFDLQLAKGKQNYIIANLDFFTPFAVTTSDEAITNGYLEKERPIYNKVKEAMFNGSYFVKPTVEKVQGTEIIMPEQKPLKTILIGIPTAKNIEVETFKSIYDLEVPEGYKTEFQYFYGYNIDQVRNLIAHWAVHYDYLFSVDSDIAFKPDTLKKLLSHDKDMVSGLYIQRKTNEHTLEVYEHTGNGGTTHMPYGKLKGRHLVEIAGCGFGCVLVKSEVLRAVGYPQFEYHSAIDHAHTISEDNDFCRKALQKGFRIWADPSVQCRHIGSYTFEVDNSIPALFKDGDEIAENLRHLSETGDVPPEHTQYLSRLRNEYGFEPKVSYDVGACVLHWTQAARKVWPNTEIIAFDAFEPSEFLFKEYNLKYHIGLLSDQDGKTLKFYRSETNPGGNSYYKENVGYSPNADWLFAEENARIMQSKTLDTVVRENGYPWPDLLKMDIQGAELDVLKGASECLRHARHVILELQIVEYNKGAPLRNEIISYMESQGFICLGLFCDNGPDGDYHFMRK